MIIGCRQLAPVFLVKVSKTYSSESLQNIWSGGETKCVLQCAIIRFIIRLTHANVWESMGKPCSCMQFIKSRIFYSKSCENPASVPVLPCFDLPFAFTRNRRSAKIKMGFRSRTLKTGEAWEQGWCSCLFYM